MYAFSHLFGTDQNLSKKKKKEKEKKIDVVIVLPRNLVSFSLLSFHIIEIGSIRIISSKGQKQGVT